MPWAESVDPSSPPPTPADALGHLFVWNYALRRQVERIESAAPDMWGTLGREIDLRFAVALRDLLRSAEYARSLIDGSMKVGISAALDAFYRAVPGARDLRDRLEHFDEYERGTGFAQKRAKISTPSVTYFENQPGRHIINVAVSGLPTASVEVELALVAADDLVKAIAEVLDASS